MRFVNRPFESTTLLNWYKRAWLRENWGIISAVAVNLKVSRQFVREVYWGRKRSKRVEAALRRRGVCLCPNQHGNRVKRPWRGRNV